MPTAIEVCEWLKEKSVRPILSCRPVKVTIGKKEYIGAFYANEEVYQPGERAVTEGKVKAGEKFQEHHFYLIGDRPKTKPVNHCFQWASGLPLDERVYKHTDEWYTSCYSSDEPRSQQPWKMFMLSEWRAHAYGYYEGHKIDTLERSVYLRLPMQVTYLDDK